MFTDYYILHCGKQNLYCQIYVWTKRITMIVRMIWPCCGFQNGAWVENPVDSFWVECTPHEIENISARWLSPQQQALKEFRSRRPEPDCNTFLLVAQDLSSIQPMEEHYPYGNLWNAYSPFRPIHPRKLILSMNCVIWTPLRYWWGPSRRAIGPSLVGCAFIRVGTARMNSGLCMVLDQLQKAHGRMETCCRLRLGRMA